MADTNPNAYANSTHVPSPAAKHPGVLKLQSIIKGDDVQTWDQVWKLQVTPWDAGFSQPPLKEVVESGEVAFPRGGEGVSKPRVLVPGCGTGYDVLYLAEELDAEAIGIDASVTATQAAQNFLQSRGQLSKGTATFQTTDFFALSPPPSEKYDVIYDYTFFVAIPPSKRPFWASQMALLLKPGGYLITLAYPIDPYVETGPPYYVRPAHYEEVLLRGPLEGKFVKVVDRDPETSTEAHKGRERLLVWRRTEA